MLLLKWCGGGGRQCGSRCVCVKGVCASLQGEWVKSITNDRERERREECAKITTTTTRRCLISSSSIKVPGSMQQKSTMEFSETVQRPCQAQSFLPLTITPAVSPGY